VLPFRIKPEHLRSLFTQFTSGVWIKPEDFTTENLLQRTQKIFWPLWLVDSDVEGQWQMEAGFDYQVESSKEYFQDGQWRSRKLVEDRIRWEPRLGGINYHVDNVPVPATRFLCESPTFFVKHYNAAQFSDIQPAPSSGQ